MLSAIISILIGNFLIGLLFKPALEHLRDIREELLSVAIPSGEKRAGRFVHQPWDTEEIAAQRQAARKAINEIFRRYQLAYGPFKRIGWVFLAALILLVNFTIITAVLGLYLTLALCIVLTAVVLGLAVALAQDAYPSPKELWSLDYLVSHFSNIHPDSLISLLDVGIEKITSDDKTRLALSCAVHLTGYKFLVAMTGGDESQRYLVAFGKVDKKTKVTYVITPDDYRWHVPLGVLDPQWPTGLGLPVSTHLFVFLPMPEGWSDPGDHPYFVSRELWVQHPGDPDRAGEIQGITTCNPRSRDRLIKFKRRKTSFSESWELVSINTDEDKDHWRLRRLVRFYRRELEGAGDIWNLSGAQLPRT